MGGAEAHEFTLIILTPDKCFFSGSAQEIIFNTPKGRVGVMAGHMPMVAAVVEDTVDILVDGAWKTAAISQGFAEISRNMAEFFVDTVEWADEIDAVRAREALERARARLKSEHSHLEHMHAQAAMARALARLKATGGLESD